MENYWTLNRQGIDVDKFILQTDFSVITVGRASDQQLQCKSKILVCIYIIVYFYTLEYIEMCCV